jgi:hypothetical protein
MNQLRNIGYFVLSKVLNVCEWQSEFVRQFFANVAIVRIDSHCQPLLYDIPDAKVRNITQSLRFVGIRQFTTPHLIPFVKLANDDKKPAMPIVSKHCGFL